MSDPTHPDNPGPEEQDDLLAAEYVLGTLSGDERRATQDRIAVDGAFAARVQAWEARLAPLNVGYQDVAVPDLLPRIEQRLFGTPAAPRVRKAGWFGLGWRGGALATALVAALVLLIVALWPAPPAPVTLRADLAAEEMDLRYAVRWSSAADELELSRVAGGDAPTGQDYELWLIGDDGVPISLGLLRDPVTRLTTVLTAGVTLAISLEPEGGSPGAAPSGPVLAVAALSEA